MCKTTNKPFRVKPFKPGFEEETEKQLAAAFCRPPKKYNKTKTKITKPNKFILSLSN